VLPTVSVRRLAPITATERGHAHRLGPVLSGHRHSFGPVGGLDIELNLHHAVLDPALYGITRLREDRKHPAIVRQHLGRELGQTHVLADCGQVLEEDRADPLALVVIGDIEGDLSAAGVDPVITPDPDDVLPHGHHEGHPVDIVHMRESMDVLVGELTQRGKEAEVDRLVRLARVEAVNALNIGWSNGA